MKIGDIEIKWLGQSGFFIKGEKNVYIDPFKIQDGMPQADIVFITHPHHDHCSIEDLQKILKDGSVIVLPAGCQSKITKLDFKVAMQIMEPDDELEVLGLRVRAVPAYNLKKEFHPKSEGWLGYVIGFGNTIVYHAGDTDLIQEMEAQVAFYSKVRIKVDMQANGIHLMQDLLGNYVSNLDVADNSVSFTGPNYSIASTFTSIQPNSIVSKISWNWDANQTTIYTDFANYG